MSNLKKAALSEVAIGALAAAAFLPWYYQIGLLRVTILLFASASLWAIGGTLNKTYRRVGVPLVILIPVAFLWRPLDWNEILRLVGAFLIMHAACRLGYGMPSLQPIDEGSELGRFWFKVFKAKMVYAELATRSTVGAAFGMAGFALWGPWSALPVLVLGLGIPFVWHELDKSGAIALVLLLVCGSAGAETYTNADVRGWNRSHEVKVANDKSFFHNSDVLAAEPNTRHPRPQRQKLERGGTLPATEIEAGFARCVRRIRRTRSFLDASWAAVPKGNKESRMSAAWHSEYDKCMEEWRA